MTERKTLADEIERRKLKFADVVAGKYEMLSGHELEMICAALRADGELAEPSKEAK